MADGDSGIEGELGNYTDYTNAADVPKENGEEEHVVENLENDHTVTETQEKVQETVQNTEDEDNRPVVELFVKVIY